MEGPTEEAEAFIPMGSSIINGGQNNMFLLNGTEHTESWYLALPPLPQFRMIRARRSGASSGAPLPYYLAAPLPQDEDIPVKKKPRLDPIIKSTSSVVTNDVLDLCSEPNDAIVDNYTSSSLLGKKRTPISTSTAEAASPDVAMVLPPPADFDEEEDHEDTNTDSAANTQSNPRATAASRHEWTREEDGVLTRAVENTCNMKGGKEYKRDWVVIAALVPDRTKDQCKNRWHRFLKNSIALAAGCEGAWTEDEDIKLKDAVQIYGGKDWAAIAELVPGRTKNQCSRRWHGYLKISIDQTAAGRLGQWTADEGAWTEDEDIKLKAAVQIYGGKDWAAIAELVPGRTKNQCSRRWHNFFKADFDRSTARFDQGVADEDLKLKHSVGGKNWIAIAPRVPGSNEN